jgi:hypothetical protein
MRAVRFHGRGDIPIDQIEEPVISSGSRKGTILEQIALLRYIYDYDSN